MKEADRPPRQPRAMNVAAEARAAEARSPSAFATRPRRRPDAGGRGRRLHDRARLRARLRRARATAAGPRLLRPASGPEHARDGPRRRAGLDGRGPPPGRAGRSRGAGRSGAVGDRCSIRRRADAVRRLRGAGAAAGARHDRAVGPRRWSPRRRWRPIPPAARGGRRPSARRTQLAATWCTSTSMRSTSPTPRCRRTPTVLRRPCRRRLTQRRAWPLFTAVVRRRRPAAPSSAAASAPFAPPR